jgi:hypothetical protein
MATNTVFQLSALSQNDPGAVDGSELFCTITQVVGGKLTTGSFPIHQGVALPIPPPPGENSATPTPTWFLIPSGQIEDTSYSLEIYCPSDANYPKTNITVKAIDVKKWAAIPYNERHNQIYQEGKYGIFGFAQEGPDGLIYTVTAGVLDPKTYG